MEVPERDEVDLLTASSVWFVVGLVRYAAGGTMPPLDTVLNVFTEEERCACVMCDCCC